MRKAAPGRGFWGALEGVPMARGTCLRFLVATAMLVAEAVLLMSLLALAPEPASTQFFDDYSKAPAPKKADPKAEAAVTTAIMVFGDSMADWLGYGLELAYAESPEIG